MLGWSQACYKLILAWSVTTTRSSDCSCMRHSACSTTVLSTMRTSSTSIRSWQKWPPNTLGRWVLLTSHHGKNAFKHFLEVSSTYIRLWQKWPPKTVGRWVLLTSHYGKNAFKHFLEVSSTYITLWQKWPPNTVEGWVLLRSWQKCLQKLLRGEFF